MREIIEFRIGEAEASSLLGNIGRSLGNVRNVRLPLKDERVRNHPMVTGAPFLRFFAGATIANAAGEAVGALGVMDVRPRARPSDEEIENLKTLARMAGELIDQAEANQRQSEQLKLLKLSEEMAGVGQWRMDAETLKSVWSASIGTSPRLNASNAVCRPSVICSVS